MSRLPIIPMILAICAAVYVPFMGSRLIRTGGDEKVYISQAIEMARDGNWFAQTLMDGPNYFKGPVHYGFVIAGLKTLGLTPWSALYMNLLALILGGIATALLIRERLPNRIGAEIWAGAFFVYNVGLYSHSFASQLEVELTAVFAWGLLLLSRSQSKDAAWLFWLTAGFAGWIKSPLHSVFMGVAAVLYWAVQGELWTRCKNPKSFLAALAGIAFCILGYLPAYCVDRENFLRLYVLKETFDKSSSGQGWPVSIVSTFGFYLFPWALISLISYAYCFCRGTALWKNAKSRSTLKLALCWAAPSVAFFMWHPYRFENYNLPVISSAILLTVLALLEAQGDAQGRWRHFYRIAFLLTAVLLLLIPIGLILLTARFSPLPEWWPAWLLPFSLGSSIYAVWAVVRYGVIENQKRLEKLALAMVCYFWMVGAVLSVFGEREIRDLRMFLKNQLATSESPSLAYFNLQKNIWSEWGILSLWLNRPVHSIHNEALLLQSVLAKDVILVPVGDSLAQFKAWVSAKMPEVKFEIIPWKRWRTRGQAEGGQTLWAQAWAERDLKILERDYYIIQIVQ